MQSVREFGVFIELEGGVTALRPGSESGVPHGQPLQSRYKMGSAVTARVLRIDADDRKMALTTRSPDEVRDSGGRSDRRRGSDGRGGDRRRDRGPRRDQGPRSWMDSDKEQVGSLGAALLKALNKDEK